MLSPLALAGFAHVGGPLGFGFGFLFLLIPLFWIGVFLLIGGIARRRWRRHGHGFGPGFGPGYGRGFGPGYGGGFGGGHYGRWSAASGAEATLAERFAQGDIDEKEFRARLEVLRANTGYAGPMQPGPMQSGPAATAPTKPAPTKPAPTKPADK